MAYTTLYSNTYEFDGGSAQCTISCSETNFSSLVNSSNYVYVTARVSRTTDSGVKCGMKLTIGSSSYTATDSSASNGTTFTISEKKVTRSSGSITVYFYKAKAATAASSICTSQYLVTQWEIKLSDYGLPANTAPTVSFSALPTLYAGQPATITWTTSDVNGDTVKTLKLTRYHKAVGASSYSNTTLISSQTTSKSYADTIPDIVGGSVYYTVTVTDGTATGTKTSSTVIVQRANTAPTLPGTPSVPSEINGGKSISISWTAATDSDGNFSGYELEISLDSGSWTQIYKGSSRSYSYTVPEGTQTIAFRVRAYDSASAYSSYATTSTFAVINGKITGTILINGVQRELTGAGYINIGGVLRELSDSNSNISGALKSLKG